MAAAPPPISQVMQDAIAEMERGTTNIYLPCKQLTDNDIRALADALKSNTTVESVGLYANKFTDVGAFALAEALRTNSTVTGVDMKGNKLSDAAVAAVNDALRGSAIDVAIANMGSSGQLKLSHEDVDEKGAMKVAEALRTMTAGPYVTDLLLDHNCIGDAGAAALADALVGNKTVTKLVLYQNEITDVGARAIAKLLGTNATIREIDLGKNRITDQGGIALAHALTHDNATVKMLSLYHNRIRETGALALADMLRHRETSGAPMQVELEDNDGITEAAENALNAARAGAKVSAALRMIRDGEVCLGHEKIGDGGVVELATQLSARPAALPTQITRLSLQGNGIGERGMTALADAFGSGAAPNLKALNLGGSMIGDAGAGALARALAGGGLTKLEELNLGLALTGRFANSEIGDGPGMVALGEALSQNASMLRILNLHSTACGDAVAAGIGKLLMRPESALTELDLHRNCIGDEGYAAIATGLAEGTETLTSLDLSSNRCGPAGAIALAGAFRTPGAAKLLEVTLGNMGDVAKEFGPGNKVGDAGAEAFAELLRGNTSVEVVNLEHNGISDFGAAALADALRENTQVTKIRLRGNPIGDRGALAFARMLEETRGTRLEDLSFTEVGGGEMSDAAHDAVMEGVKRVRVTNAIRVIEQGKVTEMTLHTHGTNNKVKIDDAGAVRFAEALEKNTSVTSVDLKHSDITDEGARALAQALLTGGGQLITTMRLDRGQGDYRISDRTGAAVDEALERNKARAVIREMDSGAAAVSVTARWPARGAWKWLSDEGVARIATALGGNTSLTSLDFSRCLIGDCGCEAIARALADGGGAGIVSLDLSESEIGDQGAAALAAGLVAKGGAQGWAAAAAETQMTPRRKGDLQVFEVGQKVEVRFGGQSKYYLGTIATVRKGADRLYDVHYDDGDQERDVAASLIRCPGGRASRIPGQVYVDLSRNKIGREGLDALKAVKGVQFELGEQAAATTFRG